MAKTASSPTTKVDAQGRRYYPASCYLCQQERNFRRQLCTPVNSVYFCADHVVAAETAKVLRSEYDFTVTYVPADGVVAPTLPAREAVAEVPAAPVQAEVSDAELLGRCVTWLLGLGRKVEESDIAGKDNPRRVAAAYVAAYEGDFAYLVDLKGRRLPLTDRQVKGVLNCLRADALRRLNADKPESKQQRTSTVEVAAGHYALPSHTGNNDADFFTVQRPTGGKWAGYTFVKRVIGGHDDTPVRGAEAKRVLAAIAADPEAGARYGQLIGRCARCNRHLTDEVSREQGYGPECIQMV